MFPAGGRAATELELPEFMASEAVKIPADGILCIVRAVPDPADPKKTKYLILAEAKIPETVREALVILDPLPQPEGDLLFRAKVQDLAKFKSGDRLYINLSETNIRVRLGNIRKHGIPFTVQTFGKGAEVTGYVRIADNAIFLFRPEKKDHIRSTQDPRFAPAERTQDRA